MPKRIKRWNDFSATNASRVEGKLAYLTLNSQTPRPPRGAVPVNTRAWSYEFVSSQHARFAFGHGCDNPNYVGVECSPIGAQLAEDLIEMSGASTVAWAAGISGGASGNHARGVLSPVRGM
jgi:hypothetical protein